MFENIFKKDITSDYCQLNLNYFTQIYNTYSSQKHKHLAYLDLHSDMIPTSTHNLGRTHSYAFSV